MQELISKYLGLDSLKQRIRFLEDKTEIEGFEVSELLMDIIKRLEQIENELGLREREQKERLKKRDEIRLKKREQEAKAKPARKRDSKGRFTK